MLALGQDKDIGHAYTKIDNNWPEAELPKQGQPLVLNPWFHLWRGHWVWKNLIFKKALYYYIILNVMITQNTS